jgi:hypothetical protein
MAQASRTVMLTLAAAVDRTVEGGLARTDEGGSN